MVFLVPKYLGDTAFNVLLLLSRVSVCVCDVQEKALGGKIRIT